MPNWRAGRLLNLRVHPITNMKISKRDVITLRADLTNDQLTMQVRDAVRTVGRAQFLGSRQTPWGFKVDFRGERGGDRFYNPRPGEEDDDSPDFIGYDKLVKAMRRFENEYTCEVDDHEKGNFTITLKLKTT